jgi:hypothetical protein
MSFVERKAADYFQKLFKEQTGLCCESVDGEDDKFEKTFWLMNDNALAIVALDRLDEPFLRNKIKAKLQTFKVSGHDAFRNLGWVDPFMHQDVFYLHPLRTAGCYRWDDSTKTFGQRLKCRAGMIGIMQEEWDGSVYRDEERYFDLAASKALSWDKQYARTRRASDRQKRSFFIARMENLWSSANLGFRKPDQNGNWTTYYLAAYLLVGEKTGWPEPFDLEKRTTVKALLNSLQQGHGGFSTWYRAQDGKVVNVEQNGNIETTSLAVYANVRPEEYTAL